MAAVRARSDGELPAVVQEKDLRGDLHTHTNLTDGLSTLEQMLETAAQRKYAYYAIFYAKEAIKGTKYSEGQKTDHNSTIVNVQGNQEDALAAPLVTLAGDNGSTQVTSTDLWCNNH